MIYCFGLFIFILNVDLFHKGLDLIDIVLKLLHKIILCIVRAIKTRKQSIPQIFRCFRHCKVLFCFSANFAEISENHIPLDIKLVLNIYAKRSKPFSDRMSYRVVAAMRRIKDILYFTVIPRAWQVDFGSALYGNHPSYWEHSAYCRFWAMYHTLFIFEQRTAFYTSLGL